MAVKRIKEYPGTWSCIGEIMSRHDDLTNLTTGARPRADHPALFRVFDFAGEQGIPVLIHHNVAPISPSGAPKDPLYLPELLNVLEEFQRTKIIWAHAGISRRIVVEDLVGLLDELVAAHKDHLYLDLSWVTFERYILKDLNGWTTLISKYPDNFMIGSDAVGRLDSYTETIRRYETLLDRLGPTVAAKVGHDNFVSVLPARGVTLPADYAYPETRYVERGRPLAARAGRQPASR